MWGMLTPNAAGGRAAQERCAEHTGQSSHISVACSIAFAL